ncbi:MAG TPA: hypothetical protein VGU90_13580, partial [Terriglobales bacterium]|nr:hypothetical protein [Terriglobales bacterium]
MNREMLPEQLDREIQQIMERRGEITTPSDSLLAIAGELRLLPSDEFREEFKNSLLEKAEQAESGSRAARAELSLQDSAGVPMLTEQRYTALPADPRSLFLSFLSHAAAVVLIASGIWAGPHIVVRAKKLTSELNYVPLPPGDKAPHGGGSGGDHSTTPASRGIPPKLSEQQLTSPMIVVRNDKSKLQVAPTVLGP